MGVRDDLLLHLEGGTIIYTCTQCMYGGTRVIVVRDGARHGLTVTVGVGDDLLLNLTGGRIIIIQLSSL